MLVCAQAMSKSPQLGYNHNIPHRGRLYHVQTEDSGLAKAHIFTHVFYDGAIIASNKVEYDPETPVDNIGQFIVGLMQSSHKSMIRQLRRGSYDKKIVSYIGEHPESSNAPKAASGGEVPPAPPTDSAPPVAPLAPVVPLAKTKPKTKPKAEPKPVPHINARPERRLPPPPRPVESQGPPLTPGRAGPTVDPTITHPVFSSPEAQAEVASSATGHGKQRPSRGPRGLRRRSLSGIGGKGVAVGTDTLLAGRRDIIVGKFASEHQTELDEEILSLLREE